MPNLPETIGRYQVLGELGRGAMGTVYRAHDPHLDRVLALKTMSPALVAETDLRQRFFREARAAAALQHANIVTIYDLGEVDGQPFIAMELLEGCTLAELIATDSELSLNDRIRLVVQICRGLGYAHSRGVVHRDIKPSNIQVLPDGTVKVLDFGVALHEGATIMTRTGQVLGTPNYMAPEQIVASQVDHRADMWSVGVILYELLSGARPFDFRTLPNLIYAIVHVDPPELDAERLGVPRAAVAIVEKVLVKNPDQRFPDLLAMEEALTKILTESGEATAEDLVLSNRTREVVSEEIPVVNSGSPAAESLEIDDAMEQVRLALAEGRRSEALTLLDSLLVIEPDMARLVQLRDLVRAEQGWTTLAPTEAPLRTGFRSVADYRQIGSFGDPFAVRAAAVAPSEDVIALGGVDGSVRVWDIDRGTQLVSLRSRMHQRAGHEGLVTCLDFSLDGTWLASGHVNGALHLWNTESAEEVDVRLSHSAAVRGIAFLADRQLLASASVDATVKLWELPSLVQQLEGRRQLMRESAAVTALGATRDGSLLITGLLPGMLRFYDTGSQRLLGGLRAHRSSVTAIAVAPRGGALLSGSEDGGLRLFDLRQLTGRLTLPGHGRAVVSAAVFPDGQYAVTAGAEGCAVLWDLEQQKKVMELGGSSGSRVVVVRAIAEGKRILVVFDDGTVRVWAAG